MIKIFYIAILGTMMVQVISSCQKKEIIGEDPYAGGKEPFGIKFALTAPSPSSGGAGAEVVFYVEGLPAWKDEMGFFINGEKCQILEVTDQYVKIKVPENVSSGIATVQLRGQVFFGPRFTILGNLVLDAGFNNTPASGTDGSIFSGYFSVQDYSLGYLLAGAGLSLVDKQGVALNGALNTDAIPFGTLYSVSRFPAGKFIVSGSLTMYQSRMGSRNYIERDIGNITRLKDDGSLDDTVVNVVNLTPQTPANGLDTVPIFNGGTQGGQIVKSFITSDNKIIAVGNFKNYSKIDYNNSTNTSRSFIITPINTVMRMNDRGRLDSTYNFRMSGTNSGAQGTVLSAAIQPDGKVVVAGNFTTYNGATVNNIVRLDGNGNPDPGFETGTGANGAINTVTYNVVQKKFMLIGNFTSFNNMPCNGVVMLNENGSVNTNFVFGATTGGSANYAKVLNNGRVLVSGDFAKYKNVTRGGFLILSPEGDAPQAYNVPGTFRGEIREVIETTSSFGNPALVLVGFLSRFDDTRVRNIIRIEIKN